MITRVLFLAGMLFSSVLYSQEISFTPVGAASDPIYADFEALFGGAYFKDLNGDNHTDIILSGINDEDYFDKPNSRLYMSDAEGSFKRADLPFQHLTAHQIDFADFDQDGDQDILFFSQKSNEEIANIENSITIYKNDGLGHFTEWQKIDFDNYNPYTAFFDDIDGDGDVDIFSLEYSANKSAETSFVTILKNNGTNYFVLDNKSSFTFSPQVRKALKIDLDNDNDNDFVFLSKDQLVFFINDGRGTYTKALMSETPFYRLNYFDMADVNGDGLPDAILGGYGSGTTVSETIQEQSESTHLFINTGDYNFIKKETFQNDYTVGGASVCFIDYDNDGDQDIYRNVKDKVGEQSMHYGEILENNGAGEFAESFVNITSTSGLAYVTDFNNDEYDDLLVLGVNRLGVKSIQMYINNQSERFITVQNSPFRAYNSTSMDLSDVDRDGDLDALVSGELFGEVNGTILYVNDGEGNYTEDTRQHFLGYGFSKAVFIDINNDGYEDIISGGKMLYENNGDGSFSEGGSLHMIDFFDVEVVDIDKDGLEDIIAANYNTIQWYRNTGNGFFEEKSSIGNAFTNPYFATGDIDGDGDLDLFMNARLSSGIYENDGTGKFSLKTSANFVDIHTCNTAFSDLDNDGDLDLLMSGGTTGTETDQLLLLNDGNGNFTKNNTNIMGVTHANLIFFDADNDGDNDVVVSGLYFHNYEGDNIKIDTKIIMYTNNGSAEFSEVENMSFVNAYNGFLAVGDIDNDDDMDLFVSGEGTSNSISRLYRNTTCWPVPDISNVVTINKNILTATALGYTYQWVNCDENNNPIDGATTQSFNAYEVGNYAVIISDGDCKLSSNCYELRTADIVSASIILFPNPSQDYIFIEGTSEALSSLQIFNVLGQEMPFTSIQDNENKLIIDIRSFSSGIYFIKTKDEDLKFSKL